MTKPIPPRIYQRLRERAARMIVLECVECGAPVVYVERVPRPQCSDCVYEERTDWSYE